MFLPICLSKKSILPAKQAFEIRFFCPGSPWAKNTSIPASVRIGGVADKTCAQLGCFVEKVPTGLFRRSEGRGKPLPYGEIRSPL